MNKKTEQAIQRIIERTRLNRHLTILTIYSSPSTLPLDLAGIGHRVLVIGSEFRKLYSLWKRGKKAGSKNLLIVESDKNLLPVKNSRIDILIICGKLPYPVKTGLEMARDFLKPGGILVWPHPRSRRLRVKRKTAHISQTIPKKAPNLSAYTSILMEAGFRDIGQVVVPRRSISWTITTGYAGAKPWTEATYTSTDNFIA